MGCEVSENSNQDNAGAVFLLIFIVMAFGFYVISSEIDKLEQRIIVLEQK